MTQKSVAVLLVIFLGAFMAALSPIGCARVEVRKEPGPAPDLSGRFQGTLVADGVSVPLEGTIVRSGETVAAATAEGRFSFQELPRGKNYLVAEKRFDSGKIRRVLGVTVVYVFDSPFPVSLKVKDATDVDRFCEDCHPRGKATRNDQIIRCLHISGVVPKNASGWRENRDEADRVTCESCHTVHQPGKTPHFLRETLEMSLLCRKCHV